MKNDIQRLFVAAGRQELVTVVCGPEMIGEFFVTKVNDDGDGAARVELVGYSEVDYKKQARETYLSCGHTFANCDCPPVEHDDDCDSFLDDDDYWDDDDD